VTGVPTLNKYNLRDVLVPSAVTDKFLSIASPNTRQNIETCGILCGHLVCDVVKGGKLSLF